MEEITTSKGRRVIIGQHWTDDDGYTSKVVGFAANGWPAVRHVNAKYQSPIMTNPSWFDHWHLTRDA